jgi:hypothetical protein
VEFEHAPEDATRRSARLALLLSIIAVAIGYGGAFTAGAATWAPWVLAIAIPASLGSIMALGATRGRTGLGRLLAPLAFVFAILALGFCFALALPAETSSSPLWLGLPRRAAIIVYGIGLLPIIVLPVAYAMTFDIQTLNPNDIERVRALARLRLEGPESDSAS